jgi:predicted transcriptional regulator
MEKGKAEGEGKRTVVRTVVKMDAELWRALKHLAVDRDMTISALIVEAIREKVEREREGEKAEGRR